MKNQKLIKKYWWILPALFFIAIAVSSMVSQTYQDSVYSEEFGVIESERTECGFFCKINPFGIRQAITIGQSTYEVGDTVEITQSVFCHDTPISTTVSDIQIEGPESDTITLYEDVLSTYTAYTQDTSFRVDTPGDYEVQQTWTCNTVEGEETHSSTTETFTVEDVDCRSDFDCSGGSTDRVCKNGDVWEIEETPTCNNNQCSLDRNEQEIESCEFGCSNAQCDPEPKETFYRFAENQCTEVQIQPSKSQSNDYESESVCKDNIVEETKDEENASITLPDNEDPNVCTQVTGRLCNPDTNTIKSYTNGCEKSDLESEGYIQDTSQCESDGDEQSFLNEIPTIVWIIVGALVVIVTIGLIAGRSKK